MFRQIINNNKRQLQKVIITTALLGAGLSVAQAEILVILPESGPMARAGFSIQQGFMHAYQASGEKMPVKLINSEQRKIGPLLRQHVNARTRVVIGPLARADVEQLIALRPKVRTLALNEVIQQHPRVLQFSLTKKDDAQTLKQLFQKDQINHLYILREPGTEAEHELLLMSLVSQLDYPVEVVDSPPRWLKHQQGVLLLGSNGWINRQNRLPKKRLYSLANAVESQQQLPQGLQFCDAPALYQSHWADVQAGIQAAKAEHFSFQRLVAFGGDAWQIANYYLKQPQLNRIEFEGRTGLIRIQDNQIQRIPKCYVQQKQLVQIL
ncbi:penicillin-binding protein activator [Acinetobacter indicus]|uniref:penicillin-binding protein activator n=1 Tax=Acinetobacter indicus TaxID=756892 RepID=UPI000CEB8729|nr:penicillin-binding protein activator [Acinetobacter indicus]